MDVVDRRILEQDVSRRQFDPVLDDGLDDLEQHALGRAVRLPVGQPLLDIVEPTQRVEVVLVVVVERGLFPQPPPDRIGIVVDLEVVRVVVQISCQRS